MSQSDNSGEILSYHRAMIAHYGAQSTYALGWRDEESQFIRFKALAGIDDLNNCSVLDAGCGYGDLLPYLLNLYPNLKHYYGIEQITELYNEAVRRYGGRQGTTLLNGDFIKDELPKSDYVLASGSLNYSSTDPDFIYKAIDKLFNSSLLGLAFNLLSQMPVKGVLVAYNPKEIIAYCKTLSNKVILIDDYADEDFTVYIYH